MFLSKKHIARRTFLKGVGVAIGLPMLDSMVPAVARAASGAAPIRRLSYIYIPHGAIMSSWTPVGEGKNFLFSPTLKALEPFRDDLVVVSGLDNKNGQGHARSSGAWLTMTRPFKTSGPDARADISADQIVAKEVGSGTRFRSLQFGLEDARTVGSCDGGYACAYTNMVSWSDPTMPLPPELNPRVAFERLFGTDDWSLDERTRARRKNFRRSILDLAREETQKLSLELGPSDRRKIDEYLNSVREIERRIQRAEQEAQVAPPFDRPAGVPTEFAEHARLMFDLQHVAFQADLTRVTSFMIAKETSYRTYPEIGVPEPHHPTSHHREEPELMGKIQKINAYHIQLLAEYIEKLKNTPDGDGSLLDHSLIVYGSGMSNSNTHVSTNLPTLVLGHGCGGLKTGKHLVCPSGTPLASFHLTMIDRMGVHLEKVGDSDGLLTELIA